MRLPISILPASMKKDRRAATKPEKTRQFGFEMLEERDLMAGAGQKVLEVLPSFVWQQALKGSIVAEPEKPESGASAHGGRGKGKSASVSHKSEEKKTELPSTDVLEDNTSNRRSLADDYWRITTNQVTSPSHPTEPLQGEFNPVPTDQNLDTETETAPVDDKRVASLGSCMEEMPVASKPIEDPEPFQSSGGNGAFDDAVTGGDGDKEPSSPGFGTGSTQTPLELSTDGGSPNAAMTMTAPTTIVNPNGLWFEQTQPVILGISEDTGASDSDGVTSDRNLVLYGLAEANTALTISRQGYGVVGTTVSDENGYWTFDYTGTTLADGSYEFTASVVADHPLGIASDFNMFVFDDLTQNYTDTQGRMAVGGNATLNGYGAGTSLQGSGGTRDDLIVGGNLVFNNGQVYSGNIVYGGTATTSSLGIPQGTIRQDQVIDFDAAEAYLTGRSEAWANIAANGMTVNQWGGITLTGTSNDLNVFELPASQLGSSWGVTINALAGSKVLINVTGQTGVIQYMQINLNGVDANDVIWNFSEATSLTIQGVTVKGTVLAPHAAVNFSNGNIDGTMIAKSLSGGGQSHLQLFGYPSPAVTSDPFLVVIDPNANGTGNHAPVAVADGFTVNEGGTLTVAAATGLLANDTDADSDILQAVLATGPQHGTLSLNADGSFVYTPDAGYFGTDSFTYTATDGTATSSPATVTINVAEVNSAPVAAADSYTVLEGGTLAVAAATGVLANDTDEDDDDLTAELVVGPAHGSLTFNADGSFVYSPTTGYYGSDTFTYRATDGADYSDPVTVTINVQEVNEAPIAHADNYQVDENGVLTVNAADGVLDNDTDADNDTLFAVLESSPQHGSLTLNPDGSFVYTPAAGFYGTDSFTYRANDGEFASNPVLVTITVNEVNEAPVGADDSYDVLEGGTLTVGAAVGVLSNDSDPDNDTLAAILADGPEHGTLTLNPDGSFVYTPDSGFFGADSFTYRASDGDLESELVTVTINVQEVNGAPVGQPDSYTLLEDGVLAVGAETGVLANDSDPDNNPLVAVLVQGPLHGTLEFNEDGSFTYTPDAGYFGSDSFRYRASDGSLTSNPITVMLSIQEVNEAPIGEPDSYSVLESGTLTVSAAQGVLANDTDPDNDSLTAILVDGPQHGSLSFNADGSFTYTPAAGYYGTDTFTYKAFDGELESDVITVTLEVIEVNEAPVSSPDTYTYVSTEESLDVAADQGVLANDSDPDANPLTAELVEGPLYGELALNADGSFTYTPFMYFRGTDSFTYRAFDGELYGEPELVTLNVPLPRGPRDGIAALLNQDYYLDHVTLDEEMNQVLVALSNTDGNLGKPTRFASGADTPTVVIAADVVGDRAIDLVVGHADGTVTFLQGTGTGGFVLRTDLTVTGLGEIIDLTAEDHDGDGDLDIGVLGSDSTHWLRNDHETPDPVLVNGDFYQGLTGWTVDGDATSVAGGTAWIHEASASLLSTLRQNFTVPADGVIRLTFDILSLGLDPTIVGNIPDAFEVSLLDASGNSLVATIDSQSTSFFNVNPDDDIRMADGVTFDGQTVTVDLTGLAAGTAATLYFDIIGALPDLDSVVALDNVVVETVQEETQAFIAIELSAPVVGSISMVSADVDDDGDLDLVIADPTEATTAVYTNDGTGGFSFFANPDLDSEIIEAASQGVIDQHDLERLRLNFILGDSARFFVVDGTSSAMFHYDAEGNIQLQTALSDASLQPRGIAANSTGSTLWTVSASGLVTVYTADGSIRGSWQATGLTEVEDIATDGIDIWLVDAGTDSVYRFVGAAARLSGSVAANDSFALDVENADATGLTTEGSYLWVTDDQDDMIYVYTIAGAFLGSWQLDAENSDASGVTLNPNSAKAGGVEMWVVDREDDRVYYYEAGLSQRSGSLSATSSFALAEGNHRAEGIADPTATMNVGDTISDVVSVAGEVDEWVFSVTAGQRVLFERISAASSQIRWQLYDPNGVSIFNSAMTTSVDVTTLSVTGDYRLVVYGNGTATGAYSFRTWDVPADPAPVEIVSGQLVEESITTPGQRREYTFDGSAGERFFFDVINAGSSPNFFGFTIIRPDGSTLFAESGSDRTTFTLSQTGTYRIIADDTTNLVATGNYSFSLWQVPADQEYSLQLDQVTNGTIQTPGQIDKFTFDASAGDRLLLDVYSYGTSTDPMGFALSGPDGSTIFAERFADLDVFTLTQSGEYTLTVRGYGASDNTGSYSFGLLTVPADPPAQPVEFNVPIQGAINTPGQQRQYTFEATAGQQFFFDVVDNGGNLIGFSILNPIGSTLFSESVSDRSNFTVSETGTYTIIVDDAAAITATGSFAFTVWEVPAVSPVPIGFQTPVSGALDSPGEVVEYTFSADAGTPLYVDLIYISGAFMDLIGPSGATVFSNATSDRTVASPSQTGTYTLRFRTSGANSLGKFNFQLNNATTAAPVPAAADLIVSNLQATPLNVGEPATVEVSWTVTNQGSVATNASDWIDRLFLSIDDSLSTRNDLRLVSVPHSGVLGAGESYTVTLQVTLPSGNSAYRLFVDTNTTNTVFEGSSVPVGNNTRSQVVNVLPELPAPGEPSLSVSQADGSHYESGSTIVIDGNAAGTPGSLNVVFVVDLSGSTSDGLGLDANGDGSVDSLDDIDGDGEIGNIRDVELGAVLNMTRLLAQWGQDVRVSLIFFGATADYADIDPDSGNQLFVDPTADGNGNLIADFEEVLRSANAGTVGAFRALSVGQGTNFQEAMQLLGQVLDAAPPADSTSVYFVTDGAASTPDVATMESVASQGINFVAMQVLEGDLSQGLSDIVSTIDAHPDSTAVGVVVTDPNELGVLLGSTVGIVSVTINGIEVDSLDAAGNFFAAVTLDPGANTFVITSTDIAGQQVTRTITLYGDLPSGVIDTDSMADVTDLGTASYRRTSYNRATGTINVSLDFTNESGDTITAPVYAVFDASTPPSVTVSNGESTTADGRSTFILDSELGASGLLDGATAEPIAVSFSNPLGERFAPNVTFWTAQNTAPRFVTVPPVTADVATEYRYEFAVADSEQADLTYSLLEGPANAIFDAANQSLVWTPIAAEMGMHTVAIEVRDGKGGVTVQRFQIGVSNPANPDNRAPLIFSEPNLLATVDDDYSYSLVAFDPDGSPVTYELLVFPDGMSIDATGKITWSPDVDDLGVHRVSIRVTDPFGASAFQTFDLEVRDVNTAPVFTSTPALELLVGGTYRYTAVAEDAEDGVRYSLVDAPAGVALDPATGRLVWNTNLTHVGSHSITVRATDDRGLSTDQTFTLTILPDDVAPSVSVYLGSGLLNPGDTTTVSVVAIDNVGIGSISVEVNGEEVLLDSTGSGTITINTPGVYQLVTTVADASGNETTVIKEIRVFDPTDTAAPEIVITGPQQGDIITYLTDVTGTVTDDNLEWIELAYAPVGSDEFVVFHHLDANGQSTIDGLLGTFDPTLLVNEDYVIRVSAQDINGQIRSEFVQVSLEGNAKLGQFEMSVTDLTIPLAGIPITISRTYDSRLAGELGDFGFGWTLDLSESRIRETVRNSQYEEQFGFFGATPFVDGTRVYITGPNGQRMGFTFKPEVYDAGLFGTLWKPKFIADPGVFAELSVDDIFLTQRDDGTFRLYMFDFSWNPSTYNLKMPDGTVYRYDQFGGLDTVTDRNNVQLTYTDAGIFSSTGESILFERDSLGRITSIIDPAGNPITYSYDTQGDLTTVTDQVGLETKFTYLSDPAHYLDTIIDPAGRQSVRTEYDDNGRVISMTDALGNATTRNYDLENQAEELSDMLGNQKFIRYDARGNIVEESDYLGYTVGYTYDSNDNVTSVTDRRGFTTSMTYDSKGNILTIQEPDGGGLWTVTYNTYSQIQSRVDPLGRMAYSEFDQNGNLIAFVDAAGSRMSYTYDALGRLSSSTDRNGNPTQYQYADPRNSQAAAIEYADGSVELIAHNGFGLVTQFVDGNGRQTKYDYDSAGRLIKVTMENGAETTLTYANHLLAASTDALGRTTQYVYDAIGRKISVVDPAGGVSQFAYDANGLAISETDALGRETRYTYDSNGQLIEATLPDGLIQTYAYDANGNQTQSINGSCGCVSVHAEYDAMGRLIRQIDAENGVTSFGYDAVGNMVETTDPLGRTTTFEYDSLNRLISQVSPDGSKMKLQYDVEGNITSSIDANGNIRTNEFDERNRLIVETDPAGFQSQFEYDNVGNLIAVTDKAGNVTAYQFDSLDRMVGATAADGGQVVYERDLIGRLAAVTDPLGRTTTYEYDALDRMTRQVDPRGAATVYSYDSVGNIVGITDALGQTTQYVWDDRDRLLGTIDPLGFASTNEYDQWGNIVETTNRNGDRRTFEYDRLFRLVKESWWEDGEASYEASYTYDAAGNLLTATDELNSYSYTYDDLDRLTTASNAGTVGIPTFAFTLSYDAAGNVLAISDNYGVTIASEYDSRNMRISQSWFGPGLDPVHLELEYDARGLTTTVRRYSDDVAGTLVGSSQYEFDSVGRITDNHHRDALDEVIAEYIYTYNPAGELISASHHGQDELYTYDPSGQLTAALYSVQENEFFSYDLVGNRVGDDYVIGPNNQLESDGTYEYFYDHEGNLIRKSEILTGNYTLYEYDHRNRLVRATEFTSDGSSVLSDTEYRYDMFNNRVAMTVDGVTTLHIYDPDGSIWADLDAGGQVVARYLLGSQVDELVARMRPGEGIAWYLTDRQGTIYDITNALGNIVNTVTYGAFGNVLSQSNIGWADRFFYSGREWDTATNQYYYRARYFDPSTGRFTQQDPLGLADDINPYRFVRNSPQQYTDPTGTMATAGYVTIGAGIGGGVAAMAFKAIQVLFESRALKFVVQVVAKNPIVLVAFVAIYVALEVARNYGPPAIEAGKRISQGVATLHLAVSNGISSYSVTAIAVLAPFLSPKIDWNDPCGALKCFTGDTPVLLPSQHAGELNQLDEEVLVGSISILLGSIMLASILVSKRSNNVFGDIGNEKGPANE